MTEADLIAKAEGRGFTDPVIRYSVCLEMKRGVKLVRHAVKIPAGSGIEDGLGVIAQWIDDETGRK